MKCCICGKEINNYGNNPFPLCAKSDYESRCCDVCNDFVTQARILSLKKKEEKNMAIGDHLIVVFWSKNSTQPTETINDNGRFLAGHIEKITDKNIMCEDIGFPIDIDNDSYIILSV